MSKESSTEMSKTDKKEFSDFYDTIIKSGNVDVGSLSFKNEIKRISSTEATSQDMEE